MKIIRLVLVAAVLTAFALAGTQLPTRVQAAAHDPSWEILTGAAGSCAPGSSVSITAEINVTSPASEQGTFTVPGYGQVGYTADTSFTGVGTFGFTIFVTTPYTVAANTPLTLTVTTYNGSNFTGGASFISSLTWDCTTGEILDRSNRVVTGSGSEPEAVVPGCDVLIAIPQGAVGGMFVADAPVYWAPGELASPAVTIPAGSSARVIGMDETGQFYQIIWVCNYLWVPANTLAPNSDAVWQGQPLPSSVVQ